jgi:chemotaxis protein MotD
MKQADLLTAAFRQLASAKVGVKDGLNGALHSKDGKEKAEHFREQMRQVSKDKSSVVAVIDKNAADVAMTAATLLLEAAAILAELAGEVKPKPLEGERLEQDEDAPKATGDGKQTAAALHEGGDPNAALSAAMSGLDLAQQNTGRNDNSIESSLAPHVDLKAKDKSLDPNDAIEASDIDVSAIDAPSAKRLTATVETGDIKSTLVSKPVIREQETHFEPVQQVTTLQKIIDRMASDLPAGAPPEGTHAAEPSQETAKSESRPVRMMTLELDPPNLGTVTIKMRLAGASVEVHLTADRLETTNLLRQERGVLSDAMQSAGYSFDIAAIDHARAPDANLNNGQSQPQQQQASSDQRGSMPSSNGSQTDGGSSGRSSGDGQNGARQNRQDHDQPHTPTERQLDQSDRRIRSSTVYL